MKQPNLGYADVKLDFACMHPAGSACRVSLCDYYDLCGKGRFHGENSLPAPSFESVTFQTRFADPSLMDLPIFMSCS